MKPEKALQELVWEIERMGGQDPVITANASTRLDGMFRAADMRSTFDDPGVAVYFERKGRRVCFSCDQYVRIWENIRAIGKTIENMRGIERWGTAEMLDRAFTGFIALPASGPPWHAVLGCAPDADKATINAAYRAKAKGAGDAALKELNLARDAGMRERAT